MPEMWSRVSPPPSLNAINYSGQRVLYSKRNIILVYVIGFITFGIYFIYWLIKTKGEINSLGATIPTSWLLAIPIANIYRMYRYCEGFSVNLKRDINTILWFLVYILVAPVMPALVQSELNKVTDYLVLQSNARVRHNWFCSREDCSVHAV